MDIIEIKHLLDAKYSLGGQLQTFGGGDCIQSFSFEP